MSNDSRADLVSITLDNISVMCTGAFGSSPLSAVYAYEIFYVDSSLLR